MAHPATTLHIYNVKKPLSDAQKDTPGVDLQESADDVSSTRLSLQRDPAGLIDISSVADGDGPYEVLRSSAPGTAPNRQEQPPQPAQPWVDRAWLAEIETRRLEAETKLTERKIDLVAAASRAEQLAREAEPTRVWLAYVSGCMFTVAVLILAVFIPNPTNFQRQVFAVLMAFSIAALTSVLPGMLDVKLSWGTKMVISATSALAVFVIVFFCLPAMAGH